MLPFIAKTPGSVGVEGTLHHKHEHTGAQGFKKHLKGHLEITQSPRLWLLRTNLRLNDTSLQSDSVFRKKAGKIRVLSQKYIC